jgi:hypothetical protein
MSFGSSGCRKLRLLPELKGAFTTGHSPDVSDLAVNIRERFRALPHHGCTRPKYGRVHFLLQIRERIGI